MQRLYWGPALYLHKVIFGPRKSHETIPLIRLQSCPPFLSLSKHYAVIVTRRYNIETTLSYF